MKILKRLSRVICAIMLIPSVFILGISFVITIPIWIITGNGVMKKTIKLIDYPMNYVIRN